ncbi:MAG: endopeptidase La [Polyangiaceae bacterium]|nr:endopeptidase La [Polyangiaceae bacterium]
MPTKKPPRSLPLLPLRDVVLFPHMVSQLFVGRERSIAALDAAMSGGKEVMLAAQRSAKVNDPNPDEVYEVGTIGLVRELLRLQDGTVKVLVEGKRRARTRLFQQEEPYFLVEVEELAEIEAGDLEALATMRTLHDTFEQYVKLNKKVPPEAMTSVASIEEPSHLADVIAASLSTLKLADRQDLLETERADRRLEKLFKVLTAEIEILQVEKKIRSRVKKQMERTQKEYYLNEQMQAIQKELGGERDDNRNELVEFGELARTKKLSKEARDRVNRELRKLKQMHPTSAEAAVVRHYLDWVLAMPWGARTEEQSLLAEAERILDEDHHGLVKIKERVLEHLAVQVLTREVSGPVLCLVGPPGVGKTSLAKSIARATARKYVRIALGGVRDEAEIRGHRRTYIGAMPGKIVQSLKKAGTDNPLILLDEIDKMSSDFRGDPASALLEVLDPEQNDAFNDHYLDLDYDLSGVMFVTTANSMSDIPPPLLDRMELIHLSGYTELEKLHIASKYLVPRQRAAAGLGNVDVSISNGAVRAILHHYTRESGVRTLEREIGGVCRKIARQVVKDGGAQGPIAVGAQDIPRYLGVPKYRPGRAEEVDEVGMTNGLSVTSVGGELLPAEVAVLPGKGKLILTGKLGDVMQESAQAAMSYVRSRGAALGLDAEFHTKIDVHVHFPEGGIPKDGPSAGITMATALVSALTKREVRRDVAMTGEITLRGRVLAIGGLKEKLLAAHRAGVTTVVLPKENKKDLADVPRRVLEALRLVLVEHVDDVLREALCLDDPDALLPPAREVTVYEHGEIVEPPSRPPTAAPRGGARGGLGSPAPQR